MKGIIKFGKAEGLMEWLFDWLNRVDKKRDKLERKVLDSQERAFWDVHRPAVSCSLSLSLCICVCVHQQF